MERQSKSGRDGWARSPENDPSPAANPKSRPGNPVPKGFRLRGFVSRCGWGALRSGLAPPPGDPASTGTRSEFAPPYAHTAHIVALGPSHAPLGRPLSSHPALEMPVQRRVPASDRHRHNMPCM